MSKVGVLVKFIAKPGNNDNYQLGMRDKLTNLSSLKKK